MELITTEELKQKLDRGDDFKLVMTFKQQAFLAKHIPGSICVFPDEASIRQINQADEIVVYCVNEGCQASVFAYRMMQQMGFRKVRRYAGGLEAWEAAGYPFEGTRTGMTIEVDSEFEA